MSEAQKCPKCGAVMTPAEEAGGMCYDCHRVDRQVEELTRLQDEIERLVKELAEERELLATTEKLLRLAYLYVPRAGYGGQLGSDRIDIETALRRIRLRDAAAAKGEGP